MVLQNLRIAIRAALGANRWRLIISLLTEASVLTAMSTLVGLALAWIGIQQLRALAPENLPRLDAIRLDSFVLGFTAITCLAATVIFGMLPAWRA